MTRKLLKLLLPVIFLPFWGSCQLSGWVFGVRFPDPGGFTLRHIWPGLHGMEVNAGRYFNLERYDYSQEVKSLGRFAKENTVFDEYVLNGSWLLQINYLYWRGLGNKERLSVFYGMGFQYRKVNINYRYYIKQLRFSPLRYVWVKSSDLLVQKQYGIDGKAGAQWASIDMPVSVFLDVGVFTVLSGTAFLSNFQAGAGVQYHFR